MVKKKGIKKVKTMKYLKFILSICMGILFICSCKKDTSPIVVDNTNGQTSVHYILISTKWKQTHTYYDTSNYAKQHLNLWPLSSTEDIPMDSCELTSKIWFNSDNNLYTIKGSGCPISDPDTNFIGTWNLISNDTKIIFNGTDTIDVLEINNNNIKLWYKSYRLDSSGSVLYTEYNMWKYEPTQ